MMTGLEGELFHELDAAFNKDKFNDLLVQFRFQRQLNQRIGVAIYILFFTVVILRGVIVRSRLRRIFSPSQLLTRLKPQNYPRQHIQAYTLCKEYGITIPTFSQLGALVCSFVLLTYSAVFGYSLRDSSSPDYVPSTEILIRWIANRTGVLSFVVLPVLIMTAGRMNILVWVTQWSFDSWNIFHRFIGRMSLLFAIVHSIAYLIYAYMRGSMNHIIENFTKLYWDCGFVALALFLVLSTLPSIRFIRKQSYEIFLVGHIVSTVGGLLALFYHTEWHLANEWLYLTIACYGFERLARIFKTTSLTPISGLLTDYGSVMRLDVYFTQCLSIGPGQFAHLRFPEVRTAESHPFSIAAALLVQHHLPKGTIMPSESDDAEWTPLIPGGHTDAPVQQVAFLIRPYDGMTKSLYELFSLKASIDRTLPVKLYFEGPYGHEYHMSKYSFVLFIAGGVGLSFTLPYILNWDTSSLKEPRMRFVWIVRSYSEIDSALDLFQHVDVRTRIEIYYTGSSDVFWDGPVEWKDRLLFGRPNIEDMMEEALVADEEMASPNAHLGVFACGPAEMLDSCRNNIEALRAFTSTSIDYIEEASTA